MTDMASIAERLEARRGGARPYLVGVTGAVASGKSTFASQLAEALAALGAIDSVDNLRLLAREQKLSLAPGLSSATEIRAAIVLAAERRIANRKAAAG